MIKHFCDRCETEITINPIKDIHFNEAHAIERKDVDGTTLEIIVFARHHEQNARFPKEFCEACVAEILLGNRE